MTAISRAEPTLFAGTPGGDSVATSTSRDGRFVAYTSDALNVLDGQVEATPAENVFLYDRQTNLTTLVSHAAGSNVTAADGVSFDAVISADGSTLAFVSTASNLIPGLANPKAVTNVFLYNIPTGATTLVSAAAGTTTNPGNEDSGNLASDPTGVTHLALSDNGSIVAYLSDATNLISGFTASAAGNGSQLYTYNTSTGATTLISHAKSSAVTASNGTVSELAMDSGGNVIAYTSTGTDSTDIATTKTGAATNTNVFLNIRTAAFPDSTLLASHGSPTAAVANPLYTSANGSSSQPVLSGDGTYVGFTSTADDALGAATSPATPAASAGEQKVFLWDWRRTPAPGVKTSYLVSHAASGVGTLPSAVAKSPFPGDSFDPSISSDGRYVAFVSQGGDLVASQAGSTGAGNVFLWDRTTEGIVLVDHQPAAAATAPNLPNQSFSGSSPKVSADGQFVAYLQDGPTNQLVAGGGGGGTTNAYLYNIATATNALVSHQVGFPTDTIPGTVSSFVFDSSSTVVFSTDAQDVSDTPATSQPLSQYQASFAYDIPSTNIDTVTLRGPNVPSVTAGGTSTITPETTGSTVSADGRYFVYTSDAANVVPNEDNIGFGTNVYLYDRVLGTNTLVSHLAGSATTTADDSFDPVISADGSTVAYISLSNGLVNGFQYGTVNAMGQRVPSFNVYVWDRATDMTVLASHNNSSPPWTTGANGDSGDVVTGTGEVTSLSLSADGRFTVFTSSAANMSLNESSFASSGSNVYLFDRASTSVDTSLILVSHNASSPFQTGHGSAFDGAVSEDGNWVVYTSDSPDAVAGQAGTAHNNVFLFNRLTGATTLVSGSKGSASTTGNGDSDSPSISADGSVIAFRSDASDLVAGTKDVNGASDVFAYLRPTATLLLASHTSGGGQSGSGASDEPLVSSNGQFIVFRSAATDLVSGQTGTANTNIFLFPVASPDTPVTLASGLAGSASTTATGDSTDPTISRDGRYVAFTSSASDLVAGETNPAKATNVFLFDRLASSAAFPYPSVRLVSGSGGSLTQGGNGDSSTPTIGGSGPVQYLAFNSAAYDLVPSDFNEWQDVFLHETDAPPTDIALSNTTVLNRSPAGTPVGSFSTIDPNPGDTFTYSLVPGTGSDDNALFTLSGNTLLLNTTASLAAGTYHVRVRSTDPGNLFFEKAFTITVVNPAQGPTDINLSSSSIPEETAAGTTVGTFSTTDPNPFPSPFTYSLVAGPGDADNAFFNVSPDGTLTTNAVFHVNVRSSFSILVRSTDAYGLSLDKAFTITVTPVPHAPVGLALSNTTVPDSSPAGTTVGTFSTVDQDVGDTFTYSLVPGPGSDDNSSFAISGNALQTATAVDFLVKPTYTIRVRTTDETGRSFDQVFTIQVAPPPAQPPTDIALNNALVQQHKPAGTPVGTFSTADASDPAGPFTYSLVSGPGGDDNSAFSINGNVLQTAAVFDFSTKSMYSIRVRTTDANGLSFDKTFTINVTVGPPGRAPERDTIGAYDPSTGTWFLRNSNSPGVPDAGSFVYGGFGWQPVTGDWNGDRQTTIGVVDATGLVPLGGSLFPTGYAWWFLRNSNSPGAPDITPFAFGLAGWIPVTGDWTGSGHTGIGMYDPTTATWFLENDPGSGKVDAVFQFGAPGWLPVTGDWDGDGVTTVGAFDPQGVVPLGGQLFSTAFAWWFLRNENSAGSADAGTFAYGEPGWRPITGDWGAQGPTGVGVVDTNGYWYLRNSPNAGLPSVAPFPFGLGPWIPVSGNWDGTLPLMAAGTPTSAPGADLTDAQLASAVSAALARLSSAGVSATVLGELGSASYHVGAVPAGYLGLASPSSHEVWVSPDAAGFGWFPDASAGSDSQFDAQGNALPGSAAVGRMDLLSVVLHEMGHLAGRGDDTQASPDDIMADSLSAGVRRVQALDTVFGSLG